MPSKGNMPHRLMIKFVQVPHPHSAVGEKFLPHKGWCPWSSHPYSSLTRGHVKCPTPPFPCPPAPSLHLPCRTQDTKGVGSAEATHSITTLWPDTTVVFSGAATMTTSCPLVDTRDPGERANQQAALLFWHLHMQHHS